MGWFAVRTFGTKGEANKYATKLRAKHRKAGHGKSMGQGGSYSIKVEAHRGGYAVMERD